MPNTIIFSTDPSLTSELVAAAKKAGDEAILVDLGDDATAPSEVAVQALADAVDETGATRVFIAGTRRGKEIAPRLAARLDAAYVAVAQDIEVGDDGLRFKRKFMGGQTLATEEVTSERVVATIAPHSFDPSDDDPAETRTVHASGIERQVNVVELKGREEGAVNIEEAEIVVAFGRGVKNEDDMDMVFELAKAIGGEVGCTRPISADLHWLGDERWIGLSGKVVKPKAYIALGISGQIQHLAGCRDSGVIVVVNTDANAPFFEHADYGIVGDLYEVIPALRKKLEG